ncbi:hypothetical protein [Jeotgalicoccus sp. S0W5]|uniref:hypothetical protein n=1 Tax=Jeotgalicoccus sp. S0W5 TaxID=2527874 RepID=UPI001F0FB281|nr:hypothetical protein [Jeotgalicoccus sp. S0W5]
MKIIYKGGAGMDIVGLVAVILTLTIPIYAIYRGYNQSDEKLEIKKMKEQRKLEEIKQENYLLENESMRIELDRIKKENARKQEALENKENKRWLIEETKEEIER